MLSGIKLLSKDEEAGDRDHKHSKDKKKHNSSSKGKKERSQKHRKEDESPIQTRDEYPRDDQHNYKVDRPNTNLPQQQREDWMTMPPIKISQPQHNNTSNTNDTQDDRGLSDQPQTAAETLHQTHRPPSSDTMATKSITVGDGGASWRMKALHRARSQATESGKNLRDVVAERWGSMQELAAGLHPKARHRTDDDTINSEKNTDPGRAHSMAHLHAARERRIGAQEERQEDNNRGGDNNWRRDDYRKEKEDRSRDAEYLKDVRSYQSKMRRPRGDSHGDGFEQLSWRKERKERNNIKRNDDNHTKAMDILDEAAKGMNAFANNGSFMELLMTGKSEKDSDEKNSKQTANVDDHFMRRQQQQGTPVEVVQSKAEEEADAKDTALPGRPSNALAQRRDASIVKDTALPGRPSNALAQRRDASIVKGRQHGERSLDALTVDNKSVAAALRARLTGRSTQATAGAQAVGAGQHGRDAVVLPSINGAGRAVPGAYGRESVAPTQTNRAAKKVQRYDEHGEKKRYFADDDDVDLSTLVKRAKHAQRGSANEGVDAAIARNIARNARFKESDLDADNEYDHDHGVELVDDATRGASKQARRHGTVREEALQREKAKQVREYNKYSSALERCALCFGSSTRQKHLTLAIGTMAYLALPSRGRLVPGHCQIVPAEHSASSRSVDENTWTEIRNFKKCVLQMHMADGMDCIFMETVVNPESVRSHTIIECVPVSHQVASKAPMYFKKAIDDATSEWSQHASKRIIDTSSKGLRAAIPPNFPYLFVEFGLTRSFVHVIDDASSFDPEMGRGVLVGLLGLPEEDMHRKARQESAALQEQWATEFRKQFDPYDWTKQL